MDRDFWHGVISNNYQLPDEAPLIELTTELFGYLGSPNRELRETFGYEILARWIIVYHYYDPADLSEMAQVLSQNLSIKLGEAATDSVFLRAASAGILALIIYRDTQDQFLDGEHVKAIASDAGHYLIHERDTRTFVADKGWANACGNTADLLRYLAYNQSLQAPDLLQILNYVAEKILQGPPHRFEHDEDDRLAKTVMAVLSRQELTSIDVDDWLRRFVDWHLSRRPEPDSYDAAYSETYHNVKLLLRALLVRIRLTQRLPASLQGLEPELIATIRVFSL